MGDAQPCTALFFVERGNVFVWRCQGGGHHYACDCPDMGKGRGKGRGGVKGSYGGGTTFE